jgi:putative nucleotidyltransferase with HDIG domain
MYKVNAYELVPGMIVSKDVIYNDMFMISKDCVLTYEIINSILKRSIDYIWVRDEYELVEVYLSSELKEKIVSSLKSIYNDVSKGKEEYLKFEKLKLIISKVIDSIFNNPDCMIQLSNLEKYDYDTFKHSVDVARYSILMGVNLNFRKNQLEKLCQSAILHDIGKCRISKEILNKPGKLTKEEYEIVKLHSKFGYEILNETGKFDFIVLRAILEHHEDFDGSGYFKKIKGTKICIFSRIIHIADVYSALTSKRPYKKKYSHYEAREYFFADGSCKFDPVILKIFLENVPIHNIGDVVTLSNKKEAIVISNNKGLLMRPVVKTIDEEKIINLSELEYANLTILT